MDDGPLYTQRSLSRLSMAAEPIKLDPDPLAPYRISPGFKVDGMLYLSGHAARAVVHYALPRRHHSRGIVTGLARAHDRNRGHRDRDLISRVKKPFCLPTRTGSPLQI